MPYKSDAQRGLFHSANSPVSKKEVKKWDKESKGDKNLPEHVKKASDGGYVECASCGGKVEHMCKGGMTGKDWMLDYKKRGK